MGILRVVAKGVRSLAKPDARNAEIDEELRAFEEASVDEKMRRGMSRGEAQRAARVETGSGEMVRQKVWAGGWESFAESVWKDMRFGVRQLVKAPGFSVVAVLSLALGIGANTAIFTIINDLMLKQLPVRDPGSLVSFGDGSSSGTMEVSQGGPIDIFPYEFYRRIEPIAGSAFEGVTAFASFPVQVSVRKGTGTEGAATQAVSHLVSGTFFNVLGVQPLMGRAFTAADSAVEGQGAVAVISHRYWQQELAADPHVLGREIAVNGTGFTVVGVMPVNFYGVELNEETPDMWLPITMQQQVMLRPSLLTPDGMFWIHIMARRKAGVALGSAQSWATTQLQRFLTDRAGAHVTAERHKAIAESTIPMMPGGGGLSHIRTGYQSPLMVLMIMVVVVLLIACANLANLLLARAVGREREFTARLALGSTRGRIVRQILTEALMLALLGGVLGLGLAFWATKALITFIDRGATHTALSATPDVRVLLFTFGVCVLTSVLFGIAPAWRGARSNVATALNTNARTATGTGAQAGKWVPKTLIVVQVMLCVVLLTAAGLLLRTLENLRAQDLGFNRTNVLLVSTNPKFAGYTPERLNDLYDRLLARINALPGVRSASIAGGPPMSRGTWGSPIFIDGHVPGPDEDVSTELNRVSAGYFETLGIPLLHGRTIGRHDTENAVKAVVVNQTLAERYFKNGDALGHSFKVADPAVVGVWQIVGIVRDAKYNGAAEKQQPFAYLALKQLTDDDRYAYCLQIRSVGDPVKITGEVRAAIAEIDPNLPVLDTRTLEEQVDSLNDVQQFVSQLAGAFALLALALAAMGLYGVISYGVARRTSEFGVRMALGAPKASIRWMVLRESVVLLAVGVAIGIPASLAATRAIRAGLFGVSATDPMTLMASVGLIGCVLVAGAYAPARRATRIDPMAALRCE
jgi:predicted permease